MVVPLPSKKIIFLLIACLVGIGAVSFAVYATKNSDTKANNKLTGSGSQAQGIELVEKALKNSTGVDSDNDGLMNWEETLWNTDSNKPDSDGDGTSDGEEVKQNRSPLKAGPNDKLATVTDATKTSAKIELEKTETAKISRDLFAYYMEAKRSGVPLDADVQKQIIDQAFSNKIIGQEPKQYSSADVRVVQSTDLKKYGNDLGLALTVGQTSNTTSEIEILNTALNTNKPEEIKKLDPIIVGYSAILTAMSVVSVPNEMLDYHLELLNSVSKVLTDIKSFRMIFEDPIVGLSGVGSYSKDLEAMRNALKQIEAVFGARGVTFEQNEYGSILMRTI